MGGEREGIHGPGQPAESVRCLQRPCTVLVLVGRNGAWGGRKEISGVWSVLFCLLCCRDPEAGAALLLLQQTAWLPMSVTGAVVNYSGAPQGGPGALVEGEHPQQVCCCMK